MRQHGRGNWIFLSLVAIVVLIAAVTFFAGEAPTVAGDRFLTALAKGDAETLSDMSYFTPERPRQEVLKEWKKSLEIARYYRFAWLMKSSSSPSPNRASVTMEFTRDATLSSAYSENFSLDLIKVKGKWLVDVRSLSRELFPAMPR